MPFTYIKNNAASTLLSTHTSASGTVVIQSGDQSNFPSSYPFRITVYKYSGTGNLGQKYGTIFKVNSASSNTFNVTVASDELPASVDQTFTVASGQVFNVECDWTYGKEQELEAQMNSSAAAIVQLQEQATALYTDTGTANAYVIAPATSIGAYANGQTFSFLPANANTGASTLNVNGLGSKNIYYQGSAITQNAIKANVIAVVRYDGTQFELLNPATTVTGILTNRQGGISNNWAGSGTTNYPLAGVNVNVQVGNTSTASGTNVIYFPVAFNESPLVLVTPNGSSGNYSGGNWYIVSVATDSFVFQTSSSNIPSVSWIAMGQ